MELGYAKTLSLGSLNKDKGIQLALVEKQYWLGLFPLIKNVGKEGDTPQYM